MFFELKKNPFLNFQSALKEAQLRGIPDHNGMSLSTVTTKNGISLPSNRVVLFKGFIRGGFSFYTNYQSRKGLDMANHSNVSTLFWWPHLDLQIRIEGQVDQLTSEESDQYFWSRPRLSQIGAWASMQSDELQSLEHLNQRVLEFENKFFDQKQIPRPPNWGGYRIVPQEFDFLFLKTGRLHERYVYQRNDQLGLKVSSFEDYQWTSFLRFP